MSVLLPPTRIPSHAEPIQNLKSEMIRERNVDTVSLPVNRKRSIAVARLYEALAAALDLEEIGRAHV